MDLLEWLLSAFKDISSDIIAALPKSPIVYLTKNAVISKYISYINWFFPVYLWISMLETWLTAIILYYGYQVILRWIKAIE